MSTLENYLHSKAEPQRGGFTLIEVLASIVIFAMMAAAVAMTMGQTSRITKKVQARESSVLGAHAALDRMQRDLQMTFDEPISRSESFFIARETAQGIELAFTYLDTPVKTLIQNRTPGVMIARYYLERGKEGDRQLFRSETPLYQKEDYTQTEGRLLVRGVQELTLEFYHFQSDRWLPEWDTASQETNKTFPRAVRILIAATDPKLPEAEQKQRVLVLETAFPVLNEMEGKR